MEKRRRAERFIAALRWLVLLPGLAALDAAMPITRAAALAGIVAVYNGALTFCASDAARFMRYGRRLWTASHVMDIAVITLLVAGSGGHGSPAYLLYWFVLVAFGFTGSSLKTLTGVAGVVLAANAAATAHALASAGSLAAMLSVVGTRSGIIFGGFLISIYVAKTRSQDDLASERGSHLQAILNCGARLTSFRNVHELALYVLESAVTETNASGGELLLVNDETQEMECEAFYSTSGAGVEEATPPGSLLLSYANWVLNSGREFMVRSGGKSGESATTTFERDDRPAAAVPLLWHSSSSDTDSSVLGVLIIWGFAGEDFDEDALDVLRIFAAIAGAAIVNLRLYTNLQKSFLRTLQSLANGLEARDEYTRGHSERVMRVACMIAEELGLASESVDSLRNASLLHDIGKIGVPDAILRKAGKLTAEEWETMRRHPTVSEEICRPLGLAPEILFLITHHHERLDGKGYPGGLSPQEQPLLQRILVVADSFDAMRSRRPYREQMPQEELMSELNKSAGRTLDPTVVDALRRMIDSGDLDAIYEEHDRVIENTIRSTKPLRQKAA